MVSRSALLRVLRATERDEGPGVQTIRSVTMGNRQASTGLSRCQRFVDVLHVVRTRLAFHAL